MTDAPASRRPPTQDDITLLAKALADHGVEYVLIGGAAMALHGFPRMTKDLDLFLPVDPENNRRLLQALASVPNSGGALAALRPQYMDEGYSTSFEGDIAIDLLYVAADKVYEDLRPHIKRVQFNGVSVATLDVDGMLVSKRTTRDEDTSDRLKLERLRNALFDKEFQRRLAAVPELLKDRAPAVRAFAEAAAAAIAAAGTVNWKDIEMNVIAFAIESGLTGDQIAEALCRHSPGAVLPGRQAALREAARGAAEAASSRNRTPNPRRDRESGR
jgi:predicted nucleotidyltransferase